jgi:hypothetical protein
VVVAVPWMPRPVVPVSVSVAPPYPRSPESITPLRFESTQTVPPIWAGRALPNGTVVTWLATTLAVWVVGLTASQPDCRFSLIVHAPAGTPALVEVPSGPVATVLGEPDGLLSPNDQLGSPISPGSRWPFPFTSSNFTIWSVPSASATSKTAVAELSSPMSEKKSSLAV